MYKEAQIDFIPGASIPNRPAYRSNPEETKELDVLIMHVGMKLKLYKTPCHFLVAQLQVELNLHKTLCHFLVAQLQDLEPNVSRKH
jgi:hypothetical protein